MKKFFMFIVIITYATALNATTIVVTSENISDGDFNLTNSYNNWAIFGADGNYDNGVNDDNGDNVFEHNLNSSTFTQLESLPNGCVVNQADNVTVTFSHTNGTNTTSMNKEDSSLYQPLGTGFGSITNCTTLTESITLSEKTKGIDIFIQSYYVNFDIEYYINNTLIETNSSMGDDSNSKKFKLSLLTNNVTNGDVLKIVFKNYSFTNTWANISMLASGESLESSFSLSNTDITVNEDFNYFDVNITNIVSSNNHDINVTVESNDTTILNFATPSATNIPYANYNNKDINISISNITNKYGKAEFNVTVDNGYYKIVKDFNITITPVNDIPTFDINMTDIIYLEDSSEFNLTINNIIDQENEDLNISIESNDTSLFSFTRQWGDSNITYSNYNGKDFNISFVPIANKYGKAELNITVWDGTTKVSKDFNITISPVNDIPTFDINMTDIIYLEDSSEFNLTINNIIDQENEDLNISIESNDTSLFNFTRQWGDSNITYSNYNGKDFNISFVPIANKYGKAELNITVWDGTTKVSKDFNITILPIDDNPILGTISNISKDMNFTDFNVSLYVIDVDFGDVNLTVDINDTSIVDINQSWYDSTNEYNLTSSEYNTTLQQLNIKPKANQEGIVRFTIKVEDNQSGAITKAFDLNISAYNLVLADLNAVSLTSPTTIDLTLPSSGIINSSAISWSSSNSAVISNSGVVTRGSSDKVTTLTATVTLAKTTLTKTFNITVTANPQTSNASSSGGGGFGGDSSSVVENSDRFTVNTSNGLQKNIIETSETKIIETTETLLSSGESSKTRVEIPKDKKVTTLKAFVEVTNSTQTTKTILQIEEGVDLSIANDKSITSKVSNDNIEAEVKLNQNAEAEAKIIVQKKVEVTMKSPKGSEIKQESSGRVTSNVTLKAITKDGVNPIEVKMSAEVEGNLVANAKVINKNGKVQTFSLSLPTNVTNGGMEFVASESDSNIYSAIKSTFNTSEDFILNPNSKRVLIEGSNIQIIGTTSWQKFEETQYFDGRRTIRLLIGDAKITRDGKEEIMVQNEEYEFTPTDSANFLSSTTSEVTTLNRIYKNSYLTIRYGWNLISNPIYKTLNIAESLKYATITYKYNSGWIKNPKTLARDEGLWVNYSAHVSEKIEGNIYYSSFLNLNSGWNLLGVGRDISFNELSQFNEIWAYDSKVKSWVKNPDIIYRGYGFWAKF